MTPKQREDVDEFLPDLAFEGLAGVVCVVRVS
jgi:hypothetical protein